MRTIFRTLVFVALCAAAAAAEDDDGHDDHDDHSAHGHEEKFEWAGSFDMKSGIHSLNLGRSKATYASPSMRIAVLFQGSSHLEDVEDAANHVMEIEWDDTKCTTALAILGAEDCPMTLKTGGGVMTLDAAMKPRSYILEMDKDATATVFKINVTSPGTYGIFAEHSMTEFEAGGHYLKDPSGEDVEPKQELPAPSPCRGDLDMGKVWGYSIGGALIVSATSFIGAILIVQVLAKGGSVAQFSIDALGDVSVINAFPAGILLGLVFLHLLPEGIEFAGGLDWRFSILIISGFLVGLATEHALILFGLKAKMGHAAHADMAHADIESPLPVKVMSPNANMMRATNDVITAYPHGMPVAQSNQEEPVTDPKVQDQVASPVRESGLAFSIFVGDFFCNLFDGIAIGSAFLSCGGLGWLVTASIVIHELPQELGDFIILVKLGMSVPKALLFNVASGLSSVLGAVIAVAIGATQDGATLNRDSGRMLAFSCGMLLYVSFGLMSEIPKVSGKGASLGAWLSLSLGIIVISLASTLWHPHCNACGAHDAHDH